MNTTHSPNEATPDGWKVIPSIEIAAGRLISERYESKNQTVTIDIDSTAAEETLRLVQSPGTWPGTVAFNLKRSVHVDGFGRVLGAATRLTRDTSRVDVGLEDRYYFFTENDPSTLQSISIHELRHCADFNNTKALLTEWTWPLWQRVRKGILSQPIGQKACQPFLRNPINEIDLYQDHPREKSARDAASRYAHQVPQIISINKHKISRQRGKLRTLLGL